MIPSYNILIILGPNPDGTKYIAKDKVLTLYKAKSFMSHPLYSHNFKANYFTNFLLHYLQVCIKLGHEKIVITIKDEIFAIFLIIYNEVYLPMASIRIGLDDFLGVYRISDRLKR